MSIGGCPSPHVETYLPNRADGETFWKHFQMFPRRSCKMQGQRGNIFKCFPVGRVDARRVDARAGSADGPSFGTSGPTGKHSGKCFPDALIAATGKHFRTGATGKHSRSRRRGNIPECFPVGAASTGKHSQLFRFSGRNVSPSLGPAPSGNVSPSARPAAGPSRMFPRSSDLGHRPNGETFP